MNDVVILSGVRTAIGDFGGSLKDVAPWELGRVVIAEAIKRAGIEPGDVEHVVLGQVIQSEPRDAYVSRIAAIAAGIPDRTPALTLNRLCGSSVQAIVSAAQMIALGECGIRVREDALHLGADNQQCASEQDGGHDQAADRDARANREASHGWISKT